MRTASTTTTIDGPRGPAGRRRGVALGDLLIIIATCGCVGVSVVVVTPRILRGQGVGQFDTEVDPRTSEEQLDSIEKLEYLCKTGRAVVGAASSPDAETNIEWLVVWTTDDRYPERVDLSEIVLLRHSSTLHTLMIYAFTGMAENDGPVDLDRVRESRYLESLIARSDVNMRVVAGGLLGLGAVTARGETLRPARLDQSPGPARLRLTWVTDSTDEPHESLLAADLPKGYLSR